MLDAKGKLLRLVTQNIDGLDFQTGIDPAKICACHGSVGRAACEGCGAPVDFDDFCQKVRTSIKDIYGVDAVDILDRGSHFLTKIVEVHGRAAALAGRPTDAPVTCTDLRGIDTRLEI